LEPPLINAQARRLSIIVIVNSHLVVRILICTYVYIVSKYISLAIDAIGHSVGLTTPLHSLILSYLGAWWQQRYPTVTQFNDGAVISNISDTGSYRVGAFLPNRGHYSIISYRIISYISYDIIYHIISYHISYHTV
jgi:hypothetical protein